MFKLNQRGVVHLLLPLLLLAGILVGVYLITSGNPLKLFSKASNPPIVFKKTDGSSLIPNSAGVPQTTSATVKIEFTSTLGSPTGGAVSSPVSAPTQSTTRSYRFAENPTDLNTAIYQLYRNEPAVVDYTFKDSSTGQKFIWVEFKDSTGRTDRRSAQIEIVSPTTTRYYRFTELQAAFGAIKGQSKYSVDYDLNHDGNINITDFSLFKAKQLEGKPIPIRYYRFTELQAAFGAIKGRSSNYNSDYDLNNDNNINITDFSLFKAQNLEGKPIPPTATVIGTPTLPLPSPDQLKRADVNHDGQVTSADALLIQRYIAGLDKILGRTFGDVNGDGKITDDDAQDVLRIVAGLPNPQTNQPYTQDQKKNADVNNDGQVNSSYALLIRRFAQGLDKVLAKMGDVNGDGQITDADSQAILKIVGGLPPQ